MIRLSLLAALAVVAVIVVGVAGRALCERPQRGLLLVAALTPFHGLLLIVPNGASLAGWKEGVLALTLLATFVTPNRPPRPRLSLPWLPAAAAFVAAGGPATTDGAGRRERSMSITLAYGPHNSSMCSSASAYNSFASSSPAPPASASPMISLPSSPRICATGFKTLLLPAPATPWMAIVRWVDDRIRRAAVSWPALRSIP